MYCVMSNFGPLGEALCSGAGGGSTRKYDFNTSNTLSGSPRACLTKASTISRTHPNFRVRRSSSSPQCVETCLAPPPPPRPNAKIAPRLTYVALGLPNADGPFANCANTSMRIHNHARWHHKPTSCRPCCLVARPPPGGSTHHTHAGSLECLDMPPQTACLRLGALVLSQERDAVQGALVLSMHAFGRFLPIAYQVCL